MSMRCAATATGAATLNSPGSRQVSPLAIQAYKQLEQGDATLTELRQALGREVTEAAVLRAITELWQQLRIIPIVSAPGTPAKWQLLRLRFQKAIADGASTSQVTAISVLASIYLQAVIASSMEEVEIFLAPLTARSKIREVLRGLVATRQVHTITLGHAPHYYVAGTLPEFAIPQTSYTSSAMPAYLLHSREHDDEIREPEPVREHLREPSRFVMPLPPPPVVTSPGIPAAASAPVVPASVIPAEVRKAPAEHHFNGHKPAVHINGAKPRPASDRPHFSHRPVARARIRKPGQSASARPSAHRVGSRPGGLRSANAVRPAASKGTRPAATKRWNQAPAKNGAGAHKSSHGSGHISAHGVNGNGAHKAAHGASGNGSRPANGASAGRNGKSVAPSWKQRNGLSKPHANGHSNGVSNGHNNSSRTANSRTAGSTSNGAKANGARTNGARPNGSRPSASRTASSRPSGSRPTGKPAADGRGKSLSGGVSSPRKDSRPAVHRRNGKPALAADAKADNSKRYGLVNRPSNGTAGKRTASKGSKRRG